MPISCEELMLKILQT